MPVYEYKCATESCGHEWEVTRSKPVKPMRITCPKCKARTGERKMTPISFVFKVGGFYQTDYKNKT